MSDNELEDQEVSFLPGTDHTGKGAMYDPSIKQKCRQLVCSVRSAIIITVCAALFIVAVALIAAFAWPNFVCECPKKNKVVTPTPPPPTQPPTDFPWKQIRLPKSVVPLLYSINMQTNMTSFAFNGSVTIDIKITEATDFIVIHSQHLNIGSKSLTCQGRQLDIRMYKENKAYNQLYLGLAEKLATGTECQLYMVFNANLSIALHGYYKSSYLDKNNKPRYLATTHFEATHARSAFPCFDEPEMKANFTMTMIHEDEYKALFNMPLQNLKTLGNGLMESKFQTSVKMSTYLVAFVVCDYENITDVTKGNVTVSVYAPPHQIEEAEFALTAAVKILDYYDTFFGVPYPLPKQDLIAIPDFNAGAMENWGLITYRMTAILYKENVSSSGNKQYVASVVAHELAHQWFGNLVTMKWWNDLWLNEGFASYVEYLGVNVVAPDWKLLDQFIVETLQSALGSDSLSNSHPISVPVHDPSEINEMFDAISYNKGSSLIRMIKGFLGGAELQSGLKQYLTQYQFSNAQTDDLWNALSDQVSETQTPINVKDVMDTWTLQMGYPMVTLQWDRQTGKVTAEQQHFLLFPQSLPSQEFTSPYGYKWYIPLSVITDQSVMGTQDMHWMKKDSVTFDVPMGVKWIKANVNMTGFYRVQYDEDNWKTIIATLKQDINVMSAADRASVLDDAFALARAGHLKTSIALDLSEYLDKETEYVPWAVGLGNLEYIGKLLEGKPAHQNYTKYITRLMREWIDKIGWNDSGPHLRKYLRALILGGAVKMGDDKAVTEARKMFNNWMTNGVPVSVNLKNVVYGGGVQHGGEREWEFVWDKYNQATVPTEKKKLLIALARSANADVINRYLHWSLDDTKVRSQDTVSVVTRLASNSAAGRILAWHFIRENWDLIYKRYGETAFKMQSLIKGVVGGFTNKFDQQEVKSFFERVPVGSGKRAVNQALEAIQMNVDWMEKHEKEVTDWFAKKA